VGILNSASDRHFPLLDGWRGLSIIAVLLGHFFPLPYINMGRFGVEMFFVLSGYLMAEMLFFRNCALPSFFKRRIFRVWPALFMFVMSVWYLSSFFLTVPVSSEIVLSCLTFTYNYAHSYLEDSVFVNHIWSLCIEEHIYMVLAIVAYLARKYKFDPLCLLVPLMLLFMINGVIQSMYAGRGYYEVYWPMLEVHLFWLGLFLVYLLID
jgi:peptidoglycan/LPS O-acetylase OafA/YrhL